MRDVTDPADQLQFRFTEVGHLPLEQIEFLTDLSGLPIFTPSTGEGQCEA
jgi:hypothetical protein